MKRIPTTAATPEFRAWFEDHVESLHELALKLASDDPEKIMTPMLLLHSRDDRLAVVPFFQFGDPDSKNLVAHVQKEMTQHHMVEATIFVSEVWTKSEPMTASLASIEAMSRDGIENDPDRGEGLMINAMMMGTSDTGAPAIMQLFAVYPYEKLEGGTKTLGKHPISGITDPVLTHHSGRFVAHEPPKN